MWLFSQPRTVFCRYSLCPTFMIIFMDLVLQTPPSWLSMPSMVPLDVAAAGRKEEEENTVRKQL